MLLTRVAAAIIFAPLLFGLVYLGGFPLAVACFILVTAMLWEFQRMLLAGTPILLRTLCFAVGLYIAALIMGFWGLSSLAIVVPSFMVIGMMLILAHPEPIELTVHRLGLVFLGALYAGGLLPYLARVRGLQEGLGLSLMALLCTWGGDTGAYFAGKAFGRHKLYPIVSPGKTVEGAMGGWLAAVVVALLIRTVFDVNIGVIHAIMVGSIAGIFGVVGDLCESLLKRSVGAKDSSGLIPGHGGVLDRFDAVMFVAPLVYIYSVLVIGVGRA